MPQCLCSAGSVFVNEFHYDNDGADTGEAVEVAVPVGVDLSTLTVYLYNGAIPTAAVTYGSMYASISPSQPHDYTTCTHRLPSCGSY